MILRSGGLLEGVFLVLAGGLGGLFFGLERLGGGFSLCAQLREALSIGLTRALCTIFYADQLDLEDECGLCANQKVSWVRGVEAMI